MVRIAVCDDDEKFAKKFIDIIKQEFIKISSGKEIECIYCANSEEMIKTYLETEISAVFMDIEVGETSGFDIAKELVKIDDNLGVVYITSHDYYVTEAFVCRPLGFIRKEKLEIDCDRAFVSVNEYIQKKNRTIMFKDGMKNLRLRIDEIVAVEVYDHKLVIIGQADNQTVKDKLVRVESELTNYGFVKTSRNRMVNLRYISKVTNGECIMTNGDSFKISEDRIKFVSNTVLIYKVRY